MPPPPCRHYLEYEEPAADGDRDLFALMAAERYRKTDRAYLSEPVNELAVAMRQIDRLEASATDQMITIAEIRRRSISDARADVITGSTPELIRRPRGRT